MIDLTPQKLLAERTLPSRIVTLGDSITDGETYALLLAQSLRNSGLPVPTIINAGVAGDTSALMLARLERDVLPYQPNLVTLLAGTNDAMRGVKPADYERNVRGIAQRLHWHGIPMLFLTPPIFGRQHEEKNPVVSSFAEVLRTLAAEYNYPLADVQTSIAQAAAGEAFSHDDIHLSFEGYRIVTQSLLDAFGFSGVVVPKKLNPPLLPGVLPEWRARIATEDASQNYDKAATILRQEGITISVPQQLEAKFNGEENHWWAKHERLRGFVYLKPALGAAEKYQAYALHHCSASHQAYLNTGANINSTWLNGTCVYQQQSFTGWHAGKERIAVHLKKGENEIFVECGPTFFLSLTERKYW